MICLGNFQSRAPGCEFEVNSGRLFLLSRSRAKNIYFYCRYSTGLSQFFSMGLLSRRAAIAEKTMRTRFGLVSDLPIIEGAISSPGPSPWRFPKWRLYAFKHFGRRGRRGRGTTPWNCRVWSTQWSDQSSNPCQRANRLSTSPLVRCELSLHQTSFSNHFISYLLLQSTVVESLNPFLRFLRGGFTGKSRPRRCFISPVL